MPDNQQDAAGPQPNWPPVNGLTTTIVPSKSAILSVYGSAHINAPATLVWQILRDTSAYPSWNTFCPRATIHAQPPSISSAEQHILHQGTSFTFHVVMDASKPSNVTDTRLRVTDISTPTEPSDYIDQGNSRDEEVTYTLDLTKVYRISWTTEGGFVARGLRSERINEIIDLGSGKGCEVRTWENQGGILARAVKFYYKDVLMKKFQQWCTELKAEAEKRAEDNKEQKNNT